MDIKDLQDASQDLVKHVNANIRCADVLEKTINKLHICHRVETVIDQVDRAIDLYLHQVGLFHCQCLQLERIILTDEILSESYLSDILCQLELRKHETAPLRWHYQFVPVLPLADLWSELTFKVIVPGLAQEKYALYVLQYFPVALGRGLL